MSTMLHLLITASSAMAADTLQGTSSECVGIRRHTTEYSATVATAHLVDLDGALGSHLESVTCDVDHTHMSLEFKHRAVATEWLLKFHDFEQHFITGGKRWNCTTINKQPMFILRRIRKTSQTEHLGRTLHVTTSMARYDEVFEDADISFGAAHDEECALAHAERTSNALRGSRTIDDEICVGANAACPTKVAKGPLPLYESASGRLSATCANCFAELSADLHVSVRIRSFRLENLAVGLQNMSVDAALQLTAHAQNSTTLALDKALGMMHPQYLLDFTVGPVPFMIFFEVPLSLKAEVDFSASADLSFGAGIHLGFGSLELTWDRKNHWQHVVPSFTHDITPSLTSKAALDLAAHMALTPAFHFHFDRIFSYGLTANPTLDAHVAGSEAAKEVCLTSSYAMDLVSRAELDININLIDFHKDWVFGPTTVGSWSGVPVKKTCVSL